MIKLLKICLLMYLLLVIPLQGMAAVGIGLCQQDVARPSIQPAETLLESTASMPHLPCHAQGNHDNPANTHSCSLCAACHMGMAMMPSALNLTMLQMAHPALQPYATPSRPDHVPDFPDRPPRFTTRLHG